MIIRMKDQLSKQAVTGEITAFFFSPCFYFCVQCQCFHREEMRYFI